MAPSVLASLPIFAGSFAQIIGLVAEYQNQRRADRAFEYEDFKKWLSERHHHDVIKLLEQNANTLVSIKALLSQDRKQLLQRLDSIDRALALNAGRFDNGFAGLAAALRPEAVLSAEAINFLREFELSGSRGVREVVSKYGLRILRAIDPATPMATPKDFDDWRYFDDDVQTLVNAGFLDVRFEPQGTRVFLPTRLASQFLQSLKPSVQAQ